MSINKFSYQSLGVAAKSLAQQLADTLENAIAANGMAIAALSGGRTPQYVFKYLREFDIEWSKVIFTLTDERWVKPDHPESNENLVRKHLLRGPLKDAKFLPLYSECNSLLEGEANCEKNLREIKQPFDAVYLGMGEDGHFASLFPGEAALKTKDKICVAVPETEYRQARLSLTVPRILNAKKIFLLFNGKRKKEVYYQASIATACDTFPIQLVLDQKKVPVYVLSAP